MNIKSNKYPLFDVFNILMDAFLVFSSYLITRTVIRLFIEIKPIRINLLICYIIVTLFLLYVYEFYTKHLRKKFEIVLSVLLVSFITGICGILYVFLNSMLSEEVKWTAIIMPVFLFLLLTLWKLVILTISRKIGGKSKLLVVESKAVENDLARKIKYSYLEIYQAWYTQIDVNDENEIQDFISGQFQEYESIFISPSIPEKLRDYLVSEAVTARKEIYVMPNLYNISVMKNETVQFDDTPALRIKVFGLSVFQQAVKRAIDLIASAIGLILSSPVFLISAIAIKLESKGSVIYSQERLTINQKKFKMYKFRTMVENAEKLTGPTLALDDDPRITKVGKYLRSLRLDELPQLVNVFMGSMSLVGPRPEREIFVKQFCREIENYDKRFLVKAGLTGAAQVYARYSTSAADKTMYDLIYIKDYSLWIDIKLILLTIKTMFVKDQSDGLKTAPDYRKSDKASGEIKMGM